MMPAVLKLSSSKSIYNRISEISKLIQHGFRPGLSCQTQLILLVDEILRAMDQHYQVDLIMLDFSKAFDTVAHNKLLLGCCY